MNAEHLLWVGEHARHLPKRQSTCQMLWDQRKLFRVIHGDRIAIDDTGIVINFSGIESWHEAGKKAGWVKLHPGTPDEASHRYWWLERYHCRSGHVMGAPRTSERMQGHLSTRIQSNLRKRLPFSSSTGYNTLPIWLDASARCAMCSSLYETVLWRTWVVWNVCASFQFFKAFPHYPTPRRIDTSHPRQQCSGPPQICMYGAQTQQGGGVGKAFCASRTFYDTRETTTFSCAFWQRKAV